MKIPSLSGLSLLLCSSIWAASPAVPGDLRSESNRRGDALVLAGFNLTHGFRLATGERATPIRLDFIIPEAGEITLSLWAETTEGEVSAQVLGPGHQMQLAWSGRKGETTVTRDLPVGKYVLEIDRSKASGGEALFGVKGSVVAPCALDPERVKEIEAKPASSFAWPYLLFVPKEVRSPQLLVVPNNTGFPTEDLELLRGSASCQLRADGAAGLATRLGTAMLVPLFPRPAGAAGQESLYLHALSRAALETSVPAWKRVDLQLVAMIRDARARLKAQGFNVEGKVLLSGFSAAGSFVNRFAMLHPEEVLAVASGSPGGWPLAPIERVGGEALTYPVGVADVAELAGQAPSLDDLRGVHWYFFLGDRDDNDAVPFRDSFSRSDQELIFRRFGANPVSRWKAAELLYLQRGLDAHFALYPNVAHEESSEMQADVARFFEGAIKGAGPQRAPK